MPAKSLADHEIPADELIRALTDPSAQAVPPTECGADASFPAGPSCLSRLVPPGYEPAYQDDRYQAEFMHPDPPLPCQEVVDALLIGWLARPIRGFLAYLAGSWRLMRREGVGAYFGHLMNWRWWRVAFRAARLRRLQGKSAL